MSPAEVHRYVCSAFDDFLQRRVAGVGPENWEPLRADLVAWARGIDAVLRLMRGLKENGVSWPGRGTLDGVRYHLGEHPAED
jgi:hypothetical protein